MVKLGGEKLVNTFQISIFKKYIFRKSRYLQNWYKDHLAKNHLSNPLRIKCLFSHLNPDTILNIKESTVLIKFICRNIY